jgi:toxin ParE1/3/4
LIVRWSGGALADLEAIQDHLLGHDPAAAARLVEVLRKAGQSLAEMPHRGRPGRWPGTRELVIPGTPYLIPYRVRGEVVQILRVFHGARAWPERP